jgi:hypothetical protein
VCYTCGVMGWWALCGDGEVTAHLQRRGTHFDETALIFCFSNTLRSAVFSIPIIELDQIQHQFNGYQAQAREDIKSRLKSGNACSHSVQILEYSSLLNKNLKTNIKITIYRILSLVSYGCGTWSLTSRKEPKLRLFDNRVLRGVFGRKWGEITEGWKRLHNDVLYHLYSSTNIVRVINSRMRWAGHVASIGRREVHTEFLWGNPRERVHLDAPVEYVRII